MIGPAIIVSIAFPQAAPAAIVHLFGILAVALIAVGIAALVTHLLFSRATTISGLVLFTVATALFYVAVGVGMKSLDRRLLQRAEQQRLERSAALEARNRLEAVTLPTRQIALLRKVPFAPLTEPYVSIYRCISPLLAAREAMYRSERRWPTDSAAVGRRCTRWAVAEHSLPVHCQAEACASAPKMTRCRHGAKRWPSRLSPTTHPCHRLNSSFFPFPKAKPAPCDGCAQHRHNPRSPRDFRAVAIGVFRPMRLRDAFSETRRRSEAPSSEQASVQEFRPTVDPRAANSSCLCERPCSCSWRNPVKYTLFLYNDEVAMAKAPPEAMPQVKAAFEAYTKSLVDAGVFVHTDWLRPSGTATVITLRDGERRVQDGPYAASKGAVGRLLRDRRGQPR